MDLHAQPAPSRLWTVVGLIVAFVLVSGLASGLYEVVFDTPSLSAPEWALSIVASLAVTVGLFWVAVGSFRRGRG